jgi:hypothetical protein
VEETNCGTEYARQHERSMSVGEEPAGISASELGKLHFESRARRMQALRLQENPSPEEVVVQQPYDEAAETHAAYANYSPFNHFLRDLHVARRTAFAQQQVATWIHDLRMKIKFRPS